MYILYGMTCRQTGLDQFYRFWQTLWTPSRDYSIKANDGRNSGHFDFNQLNDIFQADIGTDCRPNIY